MSSRLSGRKVEQSVLTVSQDALTKLMTKSKISLRLLSYLS